MRERIKLAINNYHLELNKSFIHQYLSEIYRYEKDDLMKSIKRSIWIKSIKKYSFYFTILLIFSIFPVPTFYYF